MTFALFHRHHRSRVRAASILTGAAITAITHLAFATPPPVAPAPRSPSAAASHSPPPGTPARIAEDFHKMWYVSNTTWAKNSWFGIETLQNPMDVWIIQEILQETKPDYFIECGAWKGGGAALWATLLEQINPKAKVISIDIEDRMQDARKLAIVKRKVEFIVGSSTDPKIVDDLARRTRGKKVVVLLDSDHRKPHVLQELKMYWPMVNVGSYIIVQDSNVNGHPVWPDFEGGVGGPFEAIKEFLAGNDSFQPDRMRERLMLTCSPLGYLKRIK